MPYLWFPATFAAAIAGFAGLLSAGVPLAVATYTPIAAAALAVVALELTFPERLDWRPRRGDVAADAAFMACVQVLLPRVLAATAVLALAAWTHEHAPSPWWPHAWPLGVQRFGAGQRTVTYVGVPALGGNTWPLFWQSRPSRVAPFVDPEALHSVLAPGAVVP